MIYYSKYRKNRSAGKIMNESLRQYVQQTRQEIDTEKRQRDSLLYFALLALGALGYGLFENENIDALIEHPVTIGISIACLFILTSLFWVRRKKLQQIADRWFVLEKLARDFPQDFPSPSLESIVGHGLKKGDYAHKDTVLSVALSLPIYVLLFFSLQFYGIVIGTSHLVFTFLVHRRPLKNKIESPEK